MKKNKYQIINFTSFFTIHFSAEQLVISIDKTPALHCVEIAEMSSTLNKFKKIKKFSE